MTPREEDMLERIRARRTKSEEKTVTQGIAKKDDHGSNLSTADLAQTGDVETGKEHRDVAGREIQEPASPRLPVRTQTPLQTSPTPTGSTPASSAAAGFARAMREDEESAGPLFSPDEAKKFRSQWENVQVGFVDEPRSAVEQADHLVAKAINGWPRFSPKNARTSSASGIAEKTFRPKTCAWPFAATAPSSSASSPSEL
jgi:hypothetical protein